ncbi:MAG: gliding motility-associated C-terminal domain-containing protein [Bacteroidota bacterium]
MVQLVAMADQPVDYVWTGPGGFTAGIADPAVNVPGIYSLTATAGNGCTTAAQTTVIQDNASPDLQLSVTDSLDCIVPEVQLLLTSSFSDLTYQWTGPNGFVSNEMNPIVNTAGLYTVEVIASNACSNQAQIEVSQDGAIPDIEILGDTLTCAVDSVVLQSQSSISDLSYSWTGPNGFTATVANPTIGQAGMYQLTVISSNGCQAVTQTEVLQNDTSPNLQLATDTLTCAGATIALQSFTDALSPSYQWTGPNGFTSNLAAPLVSEAGIYMLELTGANGCTQLDSTSIVADLASPSLMAFGDTLDCSNDSITLQTVSTTTGLDYQWTGPGGFSDTTANPMVNQVGIYTVTVTAPNACTTTAMATVWADSAIPDLQLTVTDSLDCVTDLVALNSQSSVDDLTYIWSGPNGFSATIANIEVSTPGIYSLTVMAPNACTNTAQVEVTQDEEIPSLTLVGGALNCVIDTVFLESQTSSTNVVYQWMGPGGFNFDLANPGVAQPGMYTLTITTENGCQASAQTTVSQNLIPPSIELLPDTLDCATSILTLMSMGDSDIITYQWTGPNAWTSTDSFPVVDVGGNYQLVVTGQNACTNSVSVDIVESLDLPDLTVIGDTLTCAQEMGQLQAISTADDPTYSWIGPDGFTASSPSPMVTVAGTYFVTITTPNACSATASTTVIADAGIPEVSLALPDTLNCNATTIQLNAITNATDLLFTWAGPAGFTSDLANPWVTQPGVYALTATAANGCTVVNALVVEQDGAVPDLMILGDTLDCTTADVQLLAQSTANLNEINWTGPSGFIATIADPIVDETGLYEVIISAENGCTAGSSFTVLRDTIKPLIQAFGDTLTCAQNSIQLSAIVIPSMGTYQWTGPGGFTANILTPTVNTAGNYSLTVTGNNGCTAESEAVVAADTALPNVMLSTDTLTCLRDTVVLQTQSNLTNLTYDWLGPNGFASAASAPQVTMPGNYQLTVTASNACTATANIDVLEDGAIPTLELAADTLTCAVPSTIIQTIATANDWTYQWTGPGGFDAQIPNPTVDLGGTYVVTVTANNGCTTMESIVIQQDNASPIIQLAGDTLNCLLGFTQMQLLQTQADWTYQWTGPDNFSASQSNPIVSQLGNYALTVTAGNGCVAETNIEVMADAEIDDLQLQTDTINCIRDSVVLIASTGVPEVTYQWTGPAGFLSTLPNPTVGNGGVYALMLTAASGCTGTADVEVSVDTLAPELTIFNALLNCEQIVDTLKSSSPNTGLLYQWTGPNGFMANTPNPLVNVGGNYMLMVTAENGCTETAQANVVVDTLAPDLVLLSDSITCAEPQASLWAISAVDDLSYNWSGPNGFMADSLNPQVEVAGWYTVTITASNGCTNSESTFVEEDESIPVAEAGMADELTCAQTTVQLSGQGSSQGPTFIYQWLNSVGMVVGTDLEIMVADSGTYQLIVTNLVGGCTESDEVEVRANTTAPEAALTAINGLSLNCDFSALVLNGDNSLPFGQLDFSWQQDGTILSTLSEIELSEVGAYSLVVTDQLNACQDTLVLEVVEDTTVPIVQIAPPAILTCALTELTLDAGNSSTGPAFEYQWTSTGNGLLSGANTLFPSINAGGNYQLLIVNQQNGCVDSAMIEVLTDQEAPIAEAGQADNLDCIVTELQLNGRNSSMGPLYRYEWTGPGIIDGGTTLTPKINEAGTYVLTVTNQQNACTAIDEVVVIEEANFPNGGIFDVQAPSCFGENDGQIQIDSIVGGTGPYLFSFNSGAFIDRNAVNRLVAGSYSLTIQDALGCEWDTLLVLNEPEALSLNVGNDWQIELGDSIELLAEGNWTFEALDTLIWSPANYLSCANCTTPVARPLQSLNYRATIVDQNGCTVTDELRIEVQKKRYVYFPNAFSPDGDGHNDQFTIYTGKDVEQVLSLQIYDRWGALVFSREDFLPDDPALEWDGTFAGKALNPAVFVYHAKVLFVDGQMETYSGDVTLLK